MLIALPGEAQMELFLDRIECDKKCTIGRLSIDGAFECFTLEDVVRADGIKIPHETAIPSGTYTVDITRSEKFDRELPLLLNVQGFVGIRIHPGNSANDTEGCILVGRRRTADAITESRLAFEALFAKLRAAKEQGEPITIDIKTSAAPVM
jgi:hypothetical protein